MFWYARNDSVIHIGFASILIDFWTLFDSGEDLIQFHFTDQTEKKPMLNTIKTQLTMNSLSVQWCVDFFLLMMILFFN